LRDCLPNKISAFEHEKVLLGIYVLTYINLAMKNGILKHVDSGLCLDTDGLKEGDDIIFNVCKKEDESIPLSQTWYFYGNYF
jgi:hypothetical protein